MADLIETVERLMARPQPKSLSAALEALKTARDRNIAAMGAFNVAEKLHGVDSEQAKTLRDGAVHVAMEAETAAEEALAAVPARSQRETLEKARALLAEGMSKETVDALRADLDRALAPPDDPVIELAERFKRLRRLLDEESADHPDGLPVEDPRLDEWHQSMTGIVRKLEKTTPTSPAGLAALADVAWFYEHGAGPEGTDTWERLQTLDPDARLMARLRHGAHVIAER